MNMGLLDSGRSAIDDDIFALSIELGRSQLGSISTTAQVSRYWQGS